MSGCATKHFNRPVKSKTVDAASVILERDPVDPFAEANAIAQDVFDIHNVKYFEGKLPNAIIRFKHLKGAFGETIIATIDTPSPLIYLDSESVADASTLGMTLLHEECHIFAHKAGDYVRGTDHGKTFNACMARLAAQGAMTEYW